MSITEHGVECAKGKTIFPRSRYHEALLPTLDRNLERFCQKNCSSSCFANTTCVAEVEMGVQKRDKQRDIKQKYP